MRQSANSRVAWIILCLFLTSLMLAGGCARKATAPSIQPESGQAAETAPGEQGKVESNLKATAESAQIWLTDARGERVWEARAESIDLDDEKKVAWLKQVKCTFVKKGRTLLSVQAGSVQVDYQKRVISLADGVRAVSPVTRGSLQADQLTWAAKQKKLSGRGNLKFSQGKVSVTGDSVVADTALKRVKVTGRAKLRAVQKGRRS